MAGQAELSRKLALHARGWFIGTNTVTQPGSKRGQYRATSLAEINT